MNLRKAEDYDQFLEVLVKWQLSPLLQNGVGVVDFNDQAAGLSADLQNN